jgi:hypothetical protein
VRGVKIKPLVSALLVITIAAVTCSAVSAEENETPQSKLLELRVKVLDAEDWLFRGVAVTNTHQLKNALARKIDATIGLYDITEHEEAADKLRNDIAPKLAICITTSVRAKSWLFVYTEDTPEYRAVQSFADECQAIIDSILMDQPK